MPIKSTGNIHVNHQILLPDTRSYRKQRNERFGLKQHEFDGFNTDLQQYMNCTNSKQTKNAVIDFVKDKSPVAAITMMFNCAIEHNQSIDLLNRFHDKLCKYQFGRTYKNREEFVCLFAFLENAVADKSKTAFMKHEDCNHFHLILCNPDGNFKTQESIEKDVLSAKKQANSDFKKAFQAEVAQSRHVPQISRCMVQEYFNFGDDDLENYVTKNLDKYGRDHDLKFDQIGYPSKYGISFG